MTYRGPSRPQPPKKRRFGWYAVYDDFVGHPKWRRVAIRSGVHVAYVGQIVMALFQAAAKAHKAGRKNGYVGDFDFEDCAAATDIPVQDISAVVRVLNDIGWLAQDFIVDWADRQPMSDDPTAADRQRNRRARQAAAKAMQMGVATEAQKALLSAEEQETLQRLANLSRVTAQPNAPERGPTPLTWFEAASESREDVAIADSHNDRIARDWLFGTGDGGSFGPASKIVADNFGCNRFTAHDMVIRWSQELRDQIMLARIIDGVEQQALNGEAFRRVVRQRIDAIISEREKGPPLPLPRVLVKGGRSA